jgi:biotin-(acetyl-CoA carboxylase) ligase
MPRALRHVAKQLLPPDPVAVASIDLPAPWKYLVLVEHAVRSQFDVLVEILRTGHALPDGLICVAGSGEGFHGQRERVWVAFPGNMHLSVFLSPWRRLDDIATGLIVLPVVSLVQTLDSIPGLENRARIKWVNDVVIDESKIAGVIMHTQSSGGMVTGAVTGIGLNVETVPTVAPTMFVPSVTSVRRHGTDPSACSLSVIFHRFLLVLARNHEKLITGRAVELMDFYRGRSLVVGRRVEVHTDIQGGALQHPAQGTVLAIGDRLELILAGERRPVFGGRVVMEPDAATGGTPMASTLMSVTPVERSQE